MSELERQLDSAKRECAAVAADRKYWASQALKLKRMNMLLLAALCGASGRVAPIQSHSMWQKETAILELKMERWAVQDRVQLLVRYLYRSRDAVGERLYRSLPALLTNPTKGSLFQEVSQVLFEARDIQTAAHCRAHFTPEKAEAMRVCTRWSWNKVRWVRDTWKWNWAAPQGARPPPSPPNLQLPPPDPPVGDSDASDVLALPPPGAQRNQDEPRRALRGPVDDDEATLHGSPDRSGNAPAAQNSAPAWLMPSLQWGGIGWGVAAVGGGSLGVSMRLEVHRGHPHVDRAPGRPAGRRHRRLDFKWTFHRCSRSNAQPLHGTAVASRGGDRDGLEVLAAAGARRASRLSMSLL